MTSRVTVIDIDTSADITENDITGIIVTTTSIIMTVMPGTTARRSGRRARMGSGIINPSGVRAGGL
jgi:hypothetical protein